MKSPGGKADVYNATSLRHISFVNFSSRGFQENQSELSTDMNNIKKESDCTTRGTDGSFIENIESDKQYFKVYSDENEQAEKVAYLERTFKFLQQQHQEILKSLHEEVETLKKKNKVKSFSVNDHKGMSKLKSKILILSLADNLPKIS
ncbi:hypothetical protein HELRODRAFT_162166 [Helobdella robusta]|uniref:CCDC92/74 N-terminal domain-containing protein n=1 Tax=Helobdella robusta TaxID=6412 RepID=T1ESB1_HELRO|nr:hypothetical protein HELRODRAFT_162166 [Helobdella robusta]ESN98714.1 hypothetical protein HELRODRAFT_162166 [Helobdella robusta]